MHGENENSTIELKLGYFFGSLQAAHGWHGDIENHNVGLELRYKLNRLPAIFRFAADVPVWSDFQDGPKSLPHYFVIIRNKNINGHGSPLWS
jgi:hypothetical protein